MLAITLVVFGLGGVHTAVAGAAASLAIVAAMLTVAYLRGRDRDVLVSLVGLALALATVLCFVQLVPVPPVLHTVLNPQGWSIYETGCQLAGIEPEAWRPLSLDPRSTADRALRYVGLAALAIWAANVRGKRAWGRFAQWLVPLAIVDLAVGFMLYSTKATTFFGLYEPVVGFRGPSTFLSTNHGGLFFGFAALVAGATALGLRRDHPRRAAVFGVCVPILLVAALAQNSDGVGLALAATALTAAIVQWFRRGRPRKMRLDVKIGVASVAALSTIVALWLDLHRIGAAFLSRIVLSGEHGGRLDLLGAGAAASMDYWRIGAGAGSVGSVIPAYVDWSVVVAASIPVIENDTLEILLSFGLPLGLLMIAAAVVQIGAVIKSGVDGARSPRYAVAIVTAVYIGILAQLHFPLLALGIGMPVVVWLELLWSRRQKSSQGARHFGTGHVAVKWPVAAAALVVLAASSMLAAQAYYAWYAPAPLTAPEALTREVWRIPASHVPYVKYATQAAAAAEPQRALALADFAVQREPSPRVRLYRAQVLAQVDVGRGAKAFGELFAEGHTSDRFIERFIIAVKSVELRVAVLKDSPAMWDRVSERIRHRDGPDGASAFVVGLAEQRPGDIAVYRLAAKVYLRIDQPLLSRLWAELVLDAERHETSGIDAPLLLARALRASGDIDGARRVLEEAATNPALVRDAHREALTLRGPPDPTLIDFVQRHHDIFCVSPIPPADQRICWGSQAWVLEANGEITAAARVLMRLRRRWNDPQPLAQLYLRAGKCVDLESLVHELEPGAARNAVEALRKRCR